MLVLFCAVVALLLALCAWRHDVLACGLLLGALGILLLLVLNSSRQRDLGLVRDKTDELQHQALHDALTGLPNRVLVIDRATQMLGRAQRIHAPTAALFIDLDDFQQVNDRFGHSAGDELLQTIAARLQAVVRGGDTVGRLGGDEFVVLLEDDRLPSRGGLVAASMQFRASRLTRQTTPAYLDGQ